MQRPEKALPAIDPTGSLAVAAEKGAMAEAGHITHGLLRLLNTQRVPVQRIVQECRENTKSCDDDMRDDELGVADAGHLTHRATRLDGELRGAARKMREYENYHTIWSWGCQ